MSLHKGDGAIESHGAVHLILEDIGVVETVWVVEIALTTTVEQVSILVTVANYR
jgi:hypothetical protein